VLESVRELAISPTMVTTDQIVRKVIELRDGHAHAALAKPRGKDGFDYGVASGRYLAFEEVRRAIEELLEEDARNDREEERMTAVAGILREE
jgi:hypothetical protein